MNTAPAPEILFERFITVEGVRYQIELKRYPESENYSVNVEREPTEQCSIWAYVFTAHYPVGEVADWFEGLRYSLRATRSQMRQCADGWQCNRKWAAAEPAGNVKGSKRSYYTKQANYWLKRTREHAAHWRLAKQLWKEITRL